MNKKPFCFIIMPFQPELHYFYLYLKNHIENTHHIDCERADAQVLTVPLLEKISDYIRRSDVVISDCTGKNPNVFYELGLAHAYDKKVILITKDPMSEAPSDVRHFEFIPYDLQRHVEFLDRVDNALRNVFVYRYEVFYERAKLIFKEFRESTNLHITMASKDVFIKRLSDAEQFKEFPDLKDDFEVAELVLPKIIADMSDMRIVEKMSTWMSERIVQPDS